MAGFVCRCFFTHNYFLKKYKLHVVFETTPQFFTDYRQILYDKGCQSDSAIQDICEKLKKEQTRRKNLAQDSVKRKHIIKTEYTPLHRHVYILKETFLAPEFIDLVKYCENKESTVAGCLKKVQEQADRVYAFPMFTREFCNDFIEEISNFEASDLPKGRPNTMNNFGVLLDELGFNEYFFDQLRKKYIQPITRLLYPEYGGATLDSQKPFIVTYKADGGDTSLDYHYDNAEVTLNVSLGKQFDEGSLYFGDMRTDVSHDIIYKEVKHLPMHGILHRGQHRHGAMPIADGERYNLIVWMRASNIRNSLCPMCNRQPELVRTEECGDGFTEHGGPSKCSVV